MLKNSSVSVPVKVEQSPEMRLAVAIVRQAWQDALAEAAEEPRLASGTSRCCEQAIHWILYDKDFAYWCRMTAMDTDAVRASLLSELRRLHAYSDSLEARIPSRCQKPD